MTETDYSMNLRTPYNLASIEAKRRLASPRSQSEQDLVFIGLYCQALQAVKGLLIKDVETSDLVRAIDAMDATHFRLIKQ